MGNHPAPPMVKIVLDTSGLTPLGVHIRLMLVVIVAELSIDLGQVALGPHQLGPTSGYVISVCDITERKIALASPQDKSVPAEREG
ncbi:MAG: hypothetical protein GZ093_07865 [Rhodoferax sp.]|uniref:hypothetical protein n=1 Tax=Rhodoferax sp. TaxID=50421 RepID=UPI0013FF45BC|nr:hypothetical protein [Rhodoferax sp.]NDP38654.1 hypothetical protein [Rhodoferax sp.]